MTRPLTVADRMPEPGDKVQIDGPVYIVVTILNRIPQVRHHLGMTQAYPLCDEFNPEVTGRCRYVSRVDGGPVEVEVQR